MAENWIYGSGALWFMSVDYVGPVRFKASYHFSRNIPEGPTALLFTKQNPQISPHDKKRVRGGPCSKTWMSVIFHPA